MKGNQTATRDPMTRCLEPHYIILPKPDGSTHFLCKACDEAWKLKKGGDRHPGNVLHLLNHARGHQK